PLLPRLEVKMVLLLQRTAQHRRELVERGQELGDRFAQRLYVKPRVARPHVLEDALLGARRDDRLRATLHEHVGPAFGATLLFNRHQAEYDVGAPVLAVAEKDHAVALDFHGASGTSSVACGAFPVPLDQGRTDAGPPATERAHG